MRRPIVHGATGAIRRLLTGTGLDHRVYALHLRRTYGARPLVVYSLPKVGSTTLLHTARAGGRAALPAHRLSPRGRAAEATQREIHPPTLRSTKVWRAGYGGLWRSEYLARRFASTSPTDPKWEIVTGVRDPVARSISAFFHAGERSDNVDPTLAPDEVDLDELRARWVATYWRGASFDWFSQELESTTGIDVFATPFPHAAGHETYANERFRVLLVRNEDIDRVGAEALARFLATPHRTPPASNRSDDKQYGGIYRRFLDTLTVPDEILDHAYESRLAAHFYTPQERSAFRQKWTS
ncbi:MAG: putative capsular polysaccharide synthesis family protein [Acidimicrobiales bacterium]